MRHGRRFSSTLLTVLGTTALAISSLLAAGPSSLAGAAQNYQWSPTYGPSAARIGQPSCPAVGWCVAPVNFDLPLPPDIAVLSGGAWTFSALPITGGNSIAGVGAVSCPVVGWCVAAGGVGNGTPGPVVWTLSGGTWTATALTGPNLGGLDGVSCAAVGSCTAVGNGTIETLSGGNWTFTAAPVAGLNPSSPGTANLQAVTCPSASVCGGGDLFR